MEKKKVIDGLLYLIRSAIIYVVLAALAVGASVVLRKPLLDKELELQQQTELIQQQVISKGELEKMLIPTEAFQLVGMVKFQQVDAAYEVFFLIMMVCNLIVFGMIISHALFSFEQDEMSGNYLFYYSQINTKIGYMIRKTVNVIINSIFSWSLYIGCILIGAKVIADQFSIQLTKINGIIVQSWKMGIIVAVLMAAIGIFYAMMKKRRMTGTIFAQYVVIGLFMMGNLFKVTQLFAYFQRITESDAKFMEKSTDILKNLQVICPFAILNPFSILNKIVIDDAWVLYLMLTVIIITGAVMLFERKEWE